MKQLSPFFFMLALITGCENKKTLAPPVKKIPAFDHFEISFKSGWLGAWCFTVDAANRYFIPPMYPSSPEDSIHYGQLPDRLVELIGHTIRQIKSDTSVNSTGHHDCDDCGAMH